MATTKELFDAVREEIKKDERAPPMHKAMGLLAVALVEQVVDDLHRSADALEKLAGDSAERLVIESAQRGD